MASNNDRFPADFGYAAPGRGEKHPAYYIPEYHQVWTEPHCAIEEVSTALAEESAHAVETHLYPSELLPLRNYLTGNDNHPGHDEFRDLIEAIYVASHPVSSRKPVCEESVRGLYSPYKKLGVDIIRQALRLAEFSAEAPGSEEARKAALWAVVVTLLSVVPLKEDQGRDVLSVLDRCDPEKRWKTSHELHEILLKHLSECVHSAGQQKPFTLIRPKDPHGLIVRSVEVICDFLDTVEEKLPAAIHPLLSVLTLGIHRVLHVVWLEFQQGILSGKAERYRFTDDNIRTLEKALLSHGIALDSGTQSEDSCAARYFQNNMLIFMRDLERRRGEVSDGFLMHEMLELFPYMLTRIIEPGWKDGFPCPVCRMAFCDDNIFRKDVERVQKISARERVRFLKAAAHFPKWIEHDCIEEIARKRKMPVQEVGTLVLSRAPTEVRKERITQERPDSYSLTGPNGDTLALFMPALGQVWIMPECPDSLLTQIQTHEQYHHDSAALQPAQLLFLRYALLDRLMDKPRRFDEIMEASYVLGLTLAAGFPPLEEFFPPAPEPHRILAARLARKARESAKACTSLASEVEAQIEAGHGILFLLHHIVPSGSGTGADIIEQIENADTQHSWNNRWELAAMVGKEMEAKCMHGNADCGFRVAPPVNAHRLAGEMLTFLAYSLQPIPERERASVKTLPTLLDLFTFGSFISIPVIRLNDREQSYEAEISVIHNDENSEQATQNALRTQGQLQSKIQKEREDCVCTRHFADILEGTKSCRLSQERDRLVKCLSHILEHLDTHSFAGNNHSCEFCQQTLTAPTVRCAIESIALTIEDGRQRLMDAASQYESWLLSDCMDLIRTTCRLTKPVRPIKKYDYL